jgi:hypothetical protein
MTHCVIKDPAVSLKPRKPIPRFHWNTESELLKGYLEYLGEYEPIATALACVNQGPVGGGGRLCRKSRDTVPLNYGH